MPRPPQGPDRESLPPEEREGFDRMEARRRAIEEAGAADPAWRDDPALGPGRGGPRFLEVVSTSPPLAADMASIGRYVKVRGDTPGSFEHWHREWAIVVVGLEIPPYSGDVRIHLPDGIAAGMRAEGVTAVAEGRDDDLTAEERTLTTYIRELIADRVQDSTFDALEEMVGTRGAVEYTIFVSFFLMQMRLKRAFDSFWPELSSAEIAAMAAGIGDGTRDNFADWRARLV